MPDAASRFSGVAGEYDAVRPRPPAGGCATAQQASQLVVDVPGAVRC
jgi:hypothetical protein